MTLISNDEVEKGVTLEMPRAVHTCASVCEPSGNNDYRAVGSEESRRRI